LKKKSILLLLLAWFSGFLGFVLGVWLDPLWLARFGSLVVLFSVMSEYSLLYGELDRLYVRLESVNSDTDIPDLTPSKWHIKKVWMSHVTISVLLSKVNDSANTLEQLSRKLFKQGVLPYYCHLLLSPTRQGKRSRTFFSTKSEGGGGNFRRATQKTTRIPSTKIYDRN
jgi:hypothetical protein